MTLGSKIQEIRNARSMSQEQFGEMLNVSRQTVSKWELDQVIPDIRKIVAISRFFCVSLDDLLSPSLLPPKNLEAPNIIAATTAITPTTFTQGRKTTFAIIFYFLNVTKILFQILFIYLFGFCLFFSKELRN